MTFKFIDMQLYSGKKHMFVHWSWHLWNRPNQMNIADWLLRHWLCKRIDWMTDPWFEFHLIHLLQRDETLSAGRSPYVNYCGILQKFVQAHISKQKVRI